MEERDRTMLEDLCPELIEAILRRVPLISRARLKCVSKTWRYLITDLRRSSPQTTSSGLVIFLKQFNNHPNLHQLCLIKAQDHQDCTLYSSTKHSLSWLIDSCNGLFLYCNKENNNWTYYLSSPILNQFVVLPQRPKPSVSARESLAFDGSHNTRFKVVCFLFHEVDFHAGNLSCLIFSSETWDWREIEAPVTNIHLLLEDGFRCSDCFSPSFYTRGRLYWTWSLCMLVFYEDGEFFKLVRLPNSKATNRGTPYSFALRFWESEGRLHYCEPTEEGFRVWVYSDEGDDQQSWQAKRLILLDKLKARTIEVLSWEYESMKARMGGDLIWPCAFNKDLQVLYLKVPPGTIFSYSFETQKLEKVLDYGKPGDSYFNSYVHPFLFNPVNLVYQKTNAI